MLYLRIRQSVAQPYRRCPPVPYWHPRYAGRRGIACRPRHAHPVRLGRERPAALAFPVFRRRVLSACGAFARRPAPVRQLRDGARLVSARRIRPQPGHGGKCPDHETGKLSHLGTVPAPGGFHGMHEPQGHRFLFCITCFRAGKMRKSWKTARQRALFPVLPPARE